MSWQASAWAIRQQIVRAPTVRHVLLCMSNYADQDGKAAFPSNASLQADTGLSERAIRKAMRELQEAGLIKLADRAIAAAITGKRAQYVPYVYHLQLGRILPSDPCG